jgi:hypothetical protein
MSGPVVLGSCRLTSYFDADENKTKVITVLFWSDGSVTWVAE